MSERWGTLIVTDGSHGIGAAVSRMAAARGYAVAVNYQRDEGAANAVVQEIRQEGGRAAALKGDVAVEHPGRLARLTPTIPMGRAGTAEEIAEDVLWLLSPAASFVTATILNVGGGRCGESTP